MPSIQLKLIDTGGRPQPNDPAISEDLCQQLVSAGVARSAVKHGRPKLASWMQRSVKSIENTISSGNLPEAHPLFALLGRDPTALHELFSRLGLVVSRKRAAPMDDADLAVGLAEASAAMTVTALNGRRDHNRTIELAELLRPLVPGILALIDEADQIRIGEPN